MIHLQCFVSTNKVGCRAAVFSSLLRATKDIKTGIGLLNPRFTLVKTVLAFLWIVFNASKAKGASHDELFQPDASDPAGDA